MRQRPNGVSVHTVFSILSAVYSARVALGKNVGVEAPTPTTLGKRQSLLEHDAVEAVEYLFGSDALYNSICIRFEAEGYKATIFGHGTPQFNVYLDPVDGTASAARMGMTDTHSNPMTDVCAVVTITPAKEGLRFGDVLASGILDLGTGQMWGAVVGEYACNAMASNISGNEASGTVMSAVRCYDKHSPRLASEFYRRINSATRFLINQSVEWSDCPSSALNILRVPLGVTDCFFNNVLPDISNEGQRGHELGAMMPFLSELQGVAYDMRTLRQLAETPFTFDGMTPVMIAVDEGTFWYYWHMIQENLAVEVAPCVTVKDTIMTLYEKAPTQRWSFRELHVPTAEEVPFLAPT